MKKIYCLILALALLTTCLAGCNSGGSADTTTTNAPQTTPSATYTTTPNTDGTEPDTKPTVPATEPTQPATEPSVPATEPTVPPTEPTVPPTEPTVPPTEPTEPTTPPTTLPTEPPTEPTTEATEKPTEPKPTEPAIGSDAQHPAELAIGDSSVNFYGEGDFWFQWIAPEDTTLMLLFDAAEDCGWRYAIYNLTAGTAFDQSGTSADELLANPAVVSVLKGDVISIAVNTLNGGNGTVTVTASLADLMGTAENPLRVHVGSATPVRVPAGATVYVNERAQGTTMVISNAEDAIATFQGTVYEPVDGVITIPMPQLEGGKADLLSISITNQGDTAQIYDVTFQIPVGTLENPAELVLGENVATLEKDDPDGYIFHYTATEDGVLTITMPSDADWCYSLYNLTSYASSAQFYSDEDPQYISYSMVVSAGDVVQISVSTYNPKRPNKIPAGTVTFIASFSQS